MSTENLLSDDDIDQLTPAQRRQLIHRLERPLDELLPTSLRRIRAARIGVMVGGAVALIPWIVYLAISLPDNYVANNWPATWVGFDLLLVFMMAATAYLGWRRRQLMILAAFATGVLLICDAWFDIMTATPDDRWISVASAVFGELPLAAVLIVGTLRIIRLIAARRWITDEQTPIWRLPLLLSQAP